MSKGRRAMYRILRVKTFLGMDPRERVSISGFEKCVQISMSRVTKIIRSFVIVIFRACFFWCTGHDHAWCTGFHTVMTKCSYKTYIRVYARIYPYIIIFPCDQLNALKVISRDACSPIKWKKNKGIRDVW